MKVSTFANNTFTDTENHWSKKWVGQLVSKKITSGFKDGTFKPNSTVSVEQFITFTIRAMQNIDSNKYEIIDGDNVRWSDKYIRTAAKHNIIYRDQFEDYKRPIKRQEMTDIIVNAYMLENTINTAFDTNTLAEKMYDYSDIDSRYKKNMTIAFKEELITGKSKKDDKSVLDPKGTATRAEAAVLIIRMMDKKSGENTNIEKDVKTFFDEYYDILLRHDKNFVKDFSKIHYKYDELEAKTGVYKKLLESKVSGSNQFKIIKIEYDINSIEKTDDNIYDVDLKTKYVTDDYMNMAIGETVRIFVDGENVLIVEDIKDDQTLDLAKFKNKVTTDFNVKEIELRKSVDYDDLTGEIIEVAFDTKLKLENTSEFDYAAKENTYTIYEFRDGQKLQEQMREGVSFKKGKNLFEWIIPEESDFNVGENELEGFVTKIYITDIENVTKNKKETLVIYKD